MAAVIAAQGLLSTSVANAAGGGQVLVDGSVLRYTTAPNDKNAVSIRISGGSYFIGDQVWMLPGVGCNYPNPNDQTVVQCSASGVSVIEVYGGDRNDEINNYTGTRSKLWGGPGDDVLRGYTFHDHLYGEDGNDILNGKSFGDHLFGGDGDDTIYGWRGNDEIDGGPGKDILYGEHNNDTISGGPGDDTLRGHDGDDALFGNAGDDDLDGGAGNNRLNGGTGTDKCINGPDIIGCES
ncbi:calcium-binding protein [Kibdelosporangium aridum]|uniref:calcium-binding protein n=1 Tax=Kibdelosporangium aridum TaxID=2030 RepID=UPI00068EF600|nr:calcium-binding protein [Kibdelosporangium aridum]